MANKKAAYLYAAGMTLVFLMFCTLFATIYFMLETFRTQNDIYLGLDLGTLIFALILNGINKKVKKAYWRAKTERD